VRAAVRSGAQSGGVVIAAMTRQEIQILRAVGMVQTAVAAKTGSSIRSVRRIAREAPVTTGGHRGAARSAEGRPALDGRAVGEPGGSVVAGRSRTARPRGDAPAARRASLPRRQERGLRAGAASPPHDAGAPRPVRRGAWGFSQHDFGQVDVRYHDGPVERVHFFASRLKWSRVVHVVLVPDEREEALIRARLAALEAFGGVPLVTVWDNPKTVSSPARASSSSGIPFPAR
jgi:hypothetical protein